MNYDENEKLIKEALKQIHTPEYDLKKAVRAELEVKQPPLKVRKKFNIGLVAAILVILSGTVIASTLPSLNKLMAILSPEMGEILQPIREENQTKEETGDNKKEVHQEDAKVIVDQGIAIKPLAVINDDDMMMIYLTIQDRAQNRINESLSIQEYFVEGGMINHAQLIGYDEESKTGIIQITTQGGHELNNTTVSVQMKRLATQRREWKEVPIPIDIKQLVSQSETTTRKMSRRDTTGGGGTGDMWQILEEQGFIEILQGSPLEINIPEVEGVTLTHIGWINERLHIQTKWKANDKDRRGYFYLVDEVGNQVAIKENNFYLVQDNENQAAGDRAIEYILEVDQEAAESMRLMGYFAEEGAAIEGEWNLEIPLEAVGEIIKIPSDIQAEGWNIKEISVSPLGVTLKGRGTGKEALQCSVLMESGEVRTFDSISTSNQAGEITMKFGMQVPLQVNQVMAVQIGEEVIQLK